MAKFRNKYRIQSLRAPWWDYGINGAYFITICTLHRKPYFGAIKNGRMELSDVGTIATRLWHEIPNHSMFVKLGEFVVMPDHIHGILILDKPVGHKEDIKTLHATSPPREPGNGDSIETLGKNNSIDTLHATSPPRESGKDQQMSRISPKPGSVSAVIRSYKSAVTKHARQSGLEHSWQSRFHDHIIRNEVEYQRIANYIINNPKNWKGDGFFDH